VELSAVDLDDETRTEEEVDAADTGDRDLSPRVQPETEHPNIEDGLDTRLAGAVGPLPQSDSEPAEQGGRTIWLSSDERVERGEGDVSFGACEVVIESVRGLRDESRRRPAGARPVDDRSTILNLRESQAGVMGRAKSRRCSGHADVRSRFVKAPDAGRCESLTAGERTTDPHGADDRRRGAGKHEPAPPHPPQATGLDEASERPPVDARCVQLARAYRAAARPDKSLDVRHDEECEARPAVTVAGGQAGALGPADTPWGGRAEIRVQESAPTFSACCPDTPFRPVPIPALGGGGGRADAALGPAGGVGGAT